MIYRSILFLILAGLFIVPALGDVSVTFADLNIVKGVHVLIYNNTGAFIGEYNTTQSVTLDPAQSYIFVLKPNEGSWFTDPFQSIELLKSSMPVIISYSMYLVLIVGLGFILTRIWR